MNVFIPIQLDATIDEFLSERIFVAGIWWW